MNGFDKPSENDNPETSKFELRKKKTKLWFLIHHTDFPLASYEVLNVAYCKYEPSFRYTVVKAALEGVSLDDIHVMHGASVSQDSLTRWSDLYEQTRSVVCHPATYLTKGQPLSMNNEEQAYIIDLVWNNRTIYISEI
ncbi:hypothetical protein MJO28_008422 [Puccinia striiformis f. sp. tritici]|uniref:Uncharacterized protein n=1 Tax=Puccinia striiformis f. sp. tritici TaxID=168172 RepID=A0ACC0EC50_9BASI|nr:hypothetical protein MJO28_008422 [Puccinia striiformis f. sp. tritici]